MHKFPLIKFSARSLSHKIQLVIVSTGIYTQVIIQQLHNWKNLGWNAEQGAGEVINSFQNTAITVWPDYTSEIFYT